MSQQSPILSIITPTYNRRHLLPRVMASVTQQTFTDFEWIIVDDGSTDGTREYLDSLDDPRIIRIYQSNQGCNAARHRGEQDMRGRFVVFLDSDDELAGPETLQRMVERIAATPAEIGVVGFGVTTPSGGGGHSQLAEPEMVLDYGDVLCERKVRGEIFRIFKRDALAVAPWWTEGLGMLTLRYFEIARHFKFLVTQELALIYHMNHGGNLTSARQTIRRAHSMIEGYERLIEAHQEGFRNACPGALGLNLFHTAMYCAIDGQNLRAVRHAIQSLKEKGPKIHNLILLGSLLVPLALRRQIFIWRSTLKGRQ